MPVWLLGSRLADEIDCTPLSVRRPTLKAGSLLALFKSVLTARVGTLTAPTSDAANASSEAILTL